jgi:hypothetical protein
MEPNRLELATQENNATAIYQRMQDPLVAIKEMGQMFAASGMFGCTKVEQGQVLALACLIEGKSPFELMRNYHIISGSLSMRASAILAEFMKKGGKCTWHSALNDCDEAKASFSLGENQLPEATYTIADATREGLVAGPNKNNWAVRPADMLRARLITKAVRMIAPGIVMGVMDDTDDPAPTAPLLSTTATTAPSVVATEETPEASLESLLYIEGFDYKKSTDFLISLGMLKEGQKLVHLSKANRSRIVKRWPEFKGKLTEFIAATPEPEAAEATKSE